VKNILQVHQHKVPNKYRNADHRKSNSQVCLISSLDIYMRAAKKPSPIILDADSATESFQVGILVKKNAGDAIIFECKAILSPHQRGNRNFVHKYASEHY